MDSTARKIIFVHQAKAAGTTLVEAFKLTYGKELVCHDQDNQNLWKMPKWRRRIELRVQPYRRYKDRRPFRVIHGHFRSEKYRRAFPDAFYLTFYRHPIQQLVSHYHYWLRNHNPADSNPFRKWVYEKRPTLVQFVERWARGRDFSRGKLIDAQHFNFVGITERIEDSMKLLQMHIPELVTGIGEHRVNPDKPVGESYVLTHDDEEALNIMLTPLISLYDEAVKRFELDWNAANKLDFLEK
ncbi:MAG: hypothetical protein ACD_23C01187G0002 [uncultured bacterium]|nr:MAG: hypothetical protein ACD_23C01187G0002 [uncultured bacterium]